MPRAVVAALPVPSVAGRTAPPVFATPAGSVDPRTNRTSLATNEKSGELLVDKVDNVYHFRVDFGRVTAATVAGASNTTGHSLFKARP